MKLYPACNKKSLWPRDLMIKVRMFDLPSASRRCEGGLLLVLWTGGLEVKSRVEVRGVETGQRKREVVSLAVPGRVHDILLEYLAGQTVSSTDTYQPIFGTTSTYSLPNPICTCSLTEYIHSTRIRDTTRTTIWTWPSSWPCRRAVQREIEIWISL